MIVTRTRAYLRHVPIETEMRYSPDMPAEVLFRFDTSDWIFSRDLLIRGMTEKAGEGDVTIWPSGVRYIEVYLESPSGKGNISMIRPEVSSFLEKTLRMVPDEDEDEIIMRELDIWLERFFRISD